MRKLIALVTMLVLAMSVKAYAGEWVEKGNEWYYEGASGWIREFGYSYFIEENGKLHTENIEEDGKFYAFNTENENMPYGALIEEDQVMIEEKEYAGISYLEIKKDNTTPDKMAFVLHGLMGNKEEYEGYGAELADRGYLVIVPDAYAHGKTVGAGSFPEIIKRSAENLNILRNLYGFDEVSIVGCSMGGMIASYYIKEGNAVDNLGLLISTLDYTILEDDMFFHSYQSGIMGASLNKEEIKRELAEISPANDLKEFSDVRIISVNSVSDPYINYEGAISKLQEANAKTNVTNLNGHAVCTNDFYTAMQNF